MKRELTEKQKQYKNMKKQIQELKDNLFNTDYQAIKYGEGALSKEEFEPMRLQREAWRQTIRRLEVELAELKRSAKQKSVE